MHLHNEYTHKICPVISQFPLYSSLANFVKYYKYKYTNNKELYLPFWMDLMVVSSRKNNEKLPTLNLTSDLIGQYERTMPAGVSAALLYEHRARQHS